MNKKWYIVQQSAEGCEYSVIDLTEKEKKIVDRFLYERKVIKEGEWIGGVGIFDEAYNTEEEAIEAIYKTF
jgi:hypothetical protein